MSEQDNWVSHNGFMDVVEAGVAQAVTSEPRLGIGIYHSRSSYQGIAYLVNPSHSGIWLPSVACRVIDALQIVSIRERLISVSYARFDSSYKALNEGAAKESHTATFVDDLMARAFNGHSSASEQKVEKSIVDFNLFHPDSAKYPLSLQVFAFFKPLTHQHV
jgi:hypothetical protein